MKEKLLKIQGYLDSKNARILSILQNGYSKERIIKMLSDSNIKSFSEIIDFYEWRNGVNENNDLTIEELELFPEGIMLSLESAIEHYNIYTKKSNLWNIKFFPLFTNGGGDFVLIDVSNSNELYLFAPSLLLSDTPIKIYDSLDSLFTTIIECFEKGAYSVNEEGLFEVDYDLKYEISERLNPLSEYWKS